MQIIRDLLSCNITKLVLIAVGLLYTKMKRNAQWRIQGRHRGASAPPPSPPPLPAPKQMRCSLHLVCVHAAGIDCSCHAARKPGDFVGRFEVETENGVYWGVAFSFNCSD